MSPEVERMRRWTHGLLAVPARGRVVDLGCGSGEDLALLAESYPSASFIGVDRSDEQIRRAKAAGVPPNGEFGCADLSRRLPFEDESVEAIYSVNVLECLPDPAAFVAECARILRPQSSIVVAHFDWDTQTFDGEDSVLVRRIVQAYNDCQQDWMPAIDPWAGRRLKRYFAGSGSFVGEVQAYTLVSDSFEPESYGRRQAESFEALVRRHLITAQDYETFMEFQHKAAERGSFFYSVTMFAFVGQKLAVPRAAQ